MKWKIKSIISHIVTEVLGCHTSKIKKMFCVWNEELSKAVWKKKEAHQTEV